MSEFGNNNYGNMNNNYDNDYVNNSYGNSNTNSNNEQSADSDRIEHLVRDIYDSHNDLLNDLTFNNFTDYLSLIRKYNDEIRHAQFGQIDMNTIRSLFYKTDEAFYAIYERIQEGDYDDDIGDKMIEYVELFDEGKRMYETKKREYEQRIREQQGGKRTKKKKRTIRRAKKSKRTVRRARKSLR